MQRFTSLFAATCFGGLIASCAHPVPAAEQTVRLVSSGDWVAAKQTSSPTESPDICSAFTRAAGRMFGLQANIVDTEVRYSDESWSLPANVSGNLILDIGHYHLPLEVATNTNTMVTSAITGEQLRSLIAATDKASWMTVTAGAASPQRVSLRGSNKATAAFLNCADSLMHGEQASRASPVQ